MRTRAALVVAAALASVIVAAGLVPTTVQAGPVNTVGVHSNYYEPQSITIAPGETVTWVWHESSHSVTSVAWDGAESFDSGVRSTGDTYEHTYTTEGVWTYYCTLHGRDRTGMWGEVIVDDGTAPAPTSSFPSTTTTTIDPADEVLVPEEQPTLKAALEVVGEGQTISVAPGTYVGAVRADTADVTIRGRGASPADVVVEGWDGSRTRGQTGIDVVADGVRIENLTVARFGTTGVRFDEVDRFAAVDVAVAGNPGFGVLAEQSRRGQLRRLAVTGSLVGVEVRRCGECDTVVDRVAVDGAGGGTGVRVTDAGSVVVSGSTFVDLGTGVLLRSSDVRSGAPQRGAHVVDNEIVGAALAGIHVDGGWHDLVQANRVTGGGHGVRVTGVPVPSNDVTVIGNVVSSGSVGLSWDGVGADVCFAGNVDDSSGASAEPTSEPPFLQTLAPC